MTTMIVANNCTHLNGQFMGDQLCYLKVAQLMLDPRNRPADVDRVIMSMSPGNDMSFLWERLLNRYGVEVVMDDLNPGDNDGRWAMWDRWRTERQINGIPFDHYRELYLRIHGAIRQVQLCGSERGLDHANIYEYLWFGQEDRPNVPPQDVDPWDCHGMTTHYKFGDDLIDHPERTTEYDVYVSPHAKTQGNTVFTFDFWSEVVHRLVDAGVSVTLGYDGWFCEDLRDNPLCRRFWGTGRDGYRNWMAELCRHKLVACGNTGTGWLAAACGVPMVTMEPPNSVMADHRYRECGLRNIVELVSEPDAARVAQIIIDQVQRRVVLTTGCYDLLHAGHVRHLERSKALGTRLIVALNSDASVRALKGADRPINPQGQRKAVLEAIRCVDEVRVFDGPNALELINEVKPDVLTAGFGYKRDDVVGVRLVEDWGGMVVITCNGDAKDEPSTTKIYRRVRAVEMLEAVRYGAQYSVNSPDKLMLMARHLTSTLHLPGDVADLGTYRGGAAMVMRRLAPTKYLHLFDTWTGTPYDDPLCHHKTGEWATSYSDMRNHMGTESRIFFHVGAFPASVGSSQACKYCFVYVDMDTEQATRDAIDHFWPRLVTGGKMVFDDYGWEPCAGVKKAIDEAFANSDQHWRGTVVPELYSYVLEKG